MKTFIKVLGVLLIIAVGLGYGCMYYVNSKIYDSSHQSKNNAIVSLVDAASSMYEDGVVNIALAGLDARGKDSDSRTDSIMMATIDKNNKEVKITSFMRDMYVPIPGKRNKYKINDAYFFGGPDLMMKTIRQDFNVNVQYYVTIDFKAFQDLVDKLGGIDLTVKPYEVKEINYYIKEVNWGNPDFIKGSGYQHLSGQQALSYCRIRHVGYNDYERTQRQREVLSLMVKKARKLNITKIPGLFNTVLPYIRTNIPAEKLLSLGVSVFRFGNTPISTLRIPVDGTYSEQVINQQDVLVPDFNKNTDLLKQFIISGNAAQDNSNTNVTKVTSSGSNASDAVQRNQIDVAILNSTGKTGLAAEYKSRLEALGYKVTQTGNYPYKKYDSTVINDYSKDGYGNILIQDLKFGNLIIKQKKKSLASIVVILGDDSLR